MPSLSATARSFFILHLLLLLAPNLRTAATAAVANAADVDLDLNVLLALKTSLSIPSSSAAFFSTWQPQNHPCNFSGVLCDVDGFVSAVALGGTGVSGAIHFDALCRLPGLVSLSLGPNHLSGTLAGVSNCTGLRILDVAGNHFTGPVPLLSSLSHLQMLNISGNALVGAFPWSSLMNLTSLSVLSAGDNLFDRAPILPSAIANLTELTVFYFSHANVAGEIPPEIGNLVQLRDLELADNGITGQIPPAITKLVNLRSLELYNNSLTGTLPPGFSNLTELQFLDASMNNLEGNLSELRLLNKLVSLQLFYNGFSGEVPQEFGNFQYLVNLSLYSNQLTGSLPPALGSWAEFDFIDVSTNMLSGPIPPDMCKRGTMTRLLILQNNFSGEIPASYGSCQTLTRFRVSNNLLSGDVPPGIWALPNVNIIDVAGNSLEGRIGAGIGMAKNLYDLYIAGNRFSGEIPSEIAGATSLVTIDAGFNELSGEIPPSIGNLRELDSLDLEGNSISGMIPAAIGTCSSLSTVNLAGNRLSGPIPASIGNLMMLNALDLSGNLLSGMIPQSLAVLKLSALNLSDNRFAGPVPSALSMAAFSQSFQGNPGLCTVNASSAPFLPQCSLPFGGMPADEVHLTLTCLVAITALLVTILATLFYIWCRRQQSGDAAPASGSGKSRILYKKGSWSVKSFRLLRVDDREIVNAIKPENLIGHGGSGNVYRSQLSSGTVVAVKHIVNNCATNVSPDNVAAAPMLSAPQQRSASMRAREYDAEVSTLSAIRHINVVQLYCSITSDELGACLLVYEYLPNGSLWDRLHSVAARKLGGLGWPERYDIALGAARGLEYLHHGCHRPILHRDVKSSNILLDEHLKPRIADFGLAKILSAASAAATASSVVAGTIGYMAPEYGYSCNLTTKSDVYSYGVVLLELVTGRMPIEPEYGDNKDIVQWVSKQLDSGEKPVSLVDMAVRQNWAREEAANILCIAMHCTGRLPSARPSMRVVVQWIEEVESRRRPLLEVKDRESELVKLASP